MARVTYVKAARKPTTCEKCGNAIAVGQPYKWCAPGFRSSKRVRCDTCPTWRPSELTGSQALSAIYGATETLEDFVSSWDGDDAESLRDALRECAEGIKEGAESYRESAQNIEDGFQHETSVSQELSEKADEVESFADEVESAADDIEDFDEDEATETAIEEVKAERGEDDDSDDEEPQEAPAATDVPSAVPEGSTPAATPAASEKADSGEKEIDADDPDVQEKVDAARQEWAEEQGEKATDAIGNCPL